MDGDEPRRARPGRAGRPFEGAGEEELFRAAFPDDWEGMRRAARGEGEDGGARGSRWEAAVELVRRALSTPLARGGAVRSAADVFRRYRYLIGDAEVEVFLVLLLDVKNRIRRDVRVSVGTLDGSLVHPREVFAPALEGRAGGVVLLHNHPSGDPAPSPEDREATRRIRAAGDIVGIPVLDHVIIGDCSYYSFREDGDW